LDFSPKPALFKARFQTLTMNIKNLKFVKWVVNKKQTRHEELSIMAEFTDDSGKKYEWLPRTEDLKKMIRAIKSSSEINKLRKEFEESFNYKVRGHREYRESGDS
jgi:hypothetical protein